MSVRKTKPHFSHEALFYDSDEQFLEGIVSLVRKGLEAGEPTLIAVGRSKGEMLRGELGEAAEEVGFLDMEELGQNPGRIIPVWREFLDRAPKDGRPLLGIGEPVWPGRDEAELEECRRHEELLNVAFDGGRAWSLVCPYDSAALSEEVLEAARQSHETVLSGDQRSEAEDWQGGDPSFLPFDGTLPAAPSDSRVLHFSRNELAEARELIAREAAQADLSRGRGTDLVVAVNELAANSVLHGGGCGKLRVWREADALVVDVRDRGRIEEPLAGRLRPSPSQEGGRGLWMVNQLCDLVQIRSGPEGTDVRLRMCLN
jgi:anti-sigma regulatory factor (Ser/Thr protein kinase)